MKAEEVSSVFSAMSSVGRGKVRDIQERMEVLQLPALSYNRVYTSIKVLCELGLALRSAHGGYFRVAPVETDVIGAVNAHWATPEEAKSAVLPHANTWSVPKNFTGILCLEKGQPRTLISAEDYYILALETNGAVSELEVGAPPYKKRGWFDRLFKS